MPAHRLTLAVLFVWVWLSAPARADALDDIRARGTLRWGADQEGGGPYVYPDPANPGRLIGFEVDLMAALAERLGVRAEFKQCEWDNLPDLLRTGGIDLICNGYELTAPRVRSMRPTIPYFVNELQLIARRDDPSIRSWDDLRRGRRRVGVLGPAAQAYVVGRLDPGSETRLYKGATEAMLDVQNRNIDATAQDFIAAAFYIGRYPALQFVDRPAGRSYYVIYTRPSDVRLSQALDDALRELIVKGQLRRIYERYGIWSSAQEQLGTPGLGAEVVAPGKAEEEPGGPSTDVRGWTALVRNLPLLLEAAGVTVLLTCLAMPLAVALGLLLALGRLYGPRSVSWVLTAYVEVVRGTPLLLQLYTIYFVLPPALGFHLDPMAAAVAGLALNYSAYESEIYRAGLLAIPAGQMEAALALGMSRQTALRRVIVPQAVRLVVPPVTNDFIAMFKDTSICSVITVVELTKEYSILVNNTNAYLELAAVTALLYLVMSYPLSLLARRLERRRGVTT